MSPIALESERSQQEEAQFADRSTRLLLALWGSPEQEMLKGKLTERLKRKNEKSEDYKGVFNKLQEQGAITINNGKIAISAQGVELLGQHLQGDDLATEGTIVGTWVVKALSKWIQQSNLAVSASNGKVSGGAIGSYEEFKPVALETYDRLNRDYNMDNLVPIYRIRRDIGNQVSRSQFNEWMLELQANDILQLVEGTVEDSSPDKIEDSIKTKLGKLRCYAKRISA